MTALKGAGQLQSPPESFFSSSHTQRASKKWYFSISLSFSLDEFTVEDQKNSFMRYIIITPGGQRLESKWVTSGYMCEEIYLEIYYKYSYLKAAWWKCPIIGVYQGKARCIRLVMWSQHVSPHGTARSRQNKKELVLDCYDFSIHLMVFNTFFKSTNYLFTCNLLNFFNLTWQFGLSSACI